MIETELGKWRRTHYSNNLDPSLAGNRCHQLWDGFQALEVMETYHF